VAPPPPAPPGIAPETAEPGGNDATVVVGIAGHAAPRTLNPFLEGPDVAVLDLLAPALFAQGYRIDPETLAPVPVVLDEIPTTANGGLVVDPRGTMEVRVRVRPGAVWADGTPITGEDLAFTIRTVLDPDLPIRADLRDRYSLIFPGSLRAQGAELEFRMRVDASVELLFDLILPAHQVAGTDFGREWDEEPWVSGGPFQVEGHAPGQYLDLRRNGRYWRTGADGSPLPRLERLVVRFFESAPVPDAPMLRGLAAGEVDAAVVSFTGPIPDEYRALESRGLRLVTVPSPGWVQFGLQFGPGNRNPESLNRHQEFRSAVAHAIDRGALAEAMETAVVESILGAYLPGLDGSPWEVYHHDPGRTRALLYRLGESIGTDLFAGFGPRMVVTAASSAPEMVALAGEIVVMLNEAGIAAELQLEAPELFFGHTLTAGTWDAALWRLRGVTGRAGAIALLRMFDPERPPLVGSNFSRWGTPDSVVSGPALMEFAALMDRLDSTVDPDEIDRLLVEAEALLAEEMVLLPLVGAGSSGAVFHPERLVGITANPAAGALWDVESWRRPDG
jgi:ABC-type transport system substrate-binding protein